MKGDAVTRLVSQVERIVEESGDPDRTAGFDAGKWVSDFLERPVPAL